MNIDREDSKFLHYFNTRDIFQDRMITMLTGKYSLDIIKLDNWMIANHDYDVKKHGSLKNFISAKFGEEAAAYIKGLLR